MKKTTNRTLTLIMALVLVASLAWMVVMAVTDSPLRMTAIPAAAICGVSAVALAKLDEMRTQEKKSYGTNSDGNARSRVA